MGVESIPEFVLGAIIAIMGYFLKVVHTDVRTNTKEIGENKGAISNCQRDVEHEREMRNEQFTYIKNTLTEIKEAIKPSKDN